MTYLLDTTAVSDWMNEHPRMQEHLRSLQAEDKVIICLVVRGEIVFGTMRLPQGRRKRELEPKSRNAMTAFPCEPVPPEAGDHCARIKLDQRRRGLSLDENDLWIAASSLALGAKLVSRDSDFSRVPGLDVEDWMH